jgi:hypothetical protein
MRPNQPVAALLQHAPASLLWTSLALASLQGCQSFATIDRHTDEKLRESAALVGEASATPRYDASKYTEGSAFPTRTAADEQPASVNPPVESLRVERRDITLETTDQIIARFNSMVEAPADAQLLSFPEAMRFAQESASEYLTAEETYIITALRLLIEEHRWGPTFFNQTSATFNANANSVGRYSTALSLSSTTSASRSVCPTAARSRPASSSMRPNSSTTRSATTGSPPTSSSRRTSRSSAARRRHRRGITGPSASRSHLRGP